MNIEQKISNIERDLKIIKANVIKPKEEKWVSGFWVSKLTGWTHEEKRNARESGIVKYKKENGSYLYLLSSIPNEFKKTA